MKTSLKLLFTQTRFKSKSALNELLLRMPTEKPGRKVLQAHRKVKMTSGSKYPAGIVNLQVLGSGRTPSLYLFTDQTRYLFNCGEGTQRLAHEHKMRLGKLEHVFVTSNRWEMIGGLPGISLTVQDIGIPQLTLHGPGGLGNLFEACKRFVILKDLQVSVVNASSQGKTHYEDHILRVDYVPIHSEEVVEETNSSEEEDKTDYYERYRKMKGQSMVEVVSENSNVKEKNTNVSLCYVVQLKKKEGTLLIDKCIAKGVPPGPLLGKLKSGEDVVLANGEVVKADDVRTADCPGPIFLVLDCPTLAHLPKLIEDEKLARHKKEPLLVVHFTKPSIMLDERYKSWMESFHVSTKHVVINGFCGGIGSEAVHRVQTKLNLIDPQIFPKLEELTTTEVTKPDMKVQLIHGETMLQVSLRPLPNNIYRQCIVAVNEESYIEETSDRTQFQSELSEYKKQILTSTPTDKYPHLLFLGTGSSIPNKTRNVSSFLLNISKSKSMIFDCGEGTLHQLVRFYGKTKVKEILSNLKAIYISHLHADHHLGLISLLKAKNEKVYLIAPKQIQSWLHLYGRRFEKISHLYELVPCSDFIENKTDRKEILESLDCSEILTENVKHCPNSFGVSIKLNTQENGYKMTYSGDTMPCDSLVKIGKGSDLLIHEATMEDELKDEAVIKMHSTVSQAIEVGKRMEAKFTILTHFSQRYAKVPKLNTNQFDKVGLAFDNMKVNCEDVEQLEKMIPVLAALFQEECDEMEMRTAKRKRKKEFYALQASASAL